MSQPCPQIFVSEFCVEKSVLSEGLIVSGLVINALQFIISFVLLYLIRKINKTKCTNIRQIISILIIFGSIFRIIFWVMRIVEFKKYSPPALARQCTNRISFTLLLLVQSMYVQTWLATVIPFENKKKIKVFKTFFNCYDIFLIIVGVFALFVTIFGRSSILYEINTKLLASCSLVTSLILVILGSISLKTIIIGIGCKIQVLIFLIISVSLLGSSIVRYLMLFWTYFTNTVIQPQELFDILTYLVADFVPIFAIQAMLFIFYFKQIERQNLEEEQNKQLEMVDMKDQVTYQ